jgi:hypothetical protein
METPLGVCVPCANIIAREDIVDAGGQKMSAIVLHLYPGHFPPKMVLADGTTIGPGLLIALKGKTEIYRAVVWAGPSKKVADPGKPDYTPTPAGTFVLLAPRAHTSTKWPFADIMWGTPLRAIPGNSTDTLYLKKGSAPGNETWGSLLADYGIHQDTLRDFYKEIFGRDGVPPVWLFNPFGPIAVRFYEDKNGNGVLDKGETRGEMFHTTPDNEAQAANGKSMEMTPSHGCVHMEPKDRDAMIFRGVLKAGNKLIIHKYTEKYGEKTY